MLSASAASVLACSALAQDDTPNSKTERSAYSQERMARPRADRLNGAAKASDLIGMEVKNYQGEKLGKVEDLAVDVESGRIVQVILSTGGFAGIGDTLTAVPPGALHHDVAQKVLHLDANKEKLKGAPKFETSKWAECCDSNHLSAVYGYYGEESAFKFIHKGDVAMDSQRNRDGVRTTDGQINRDEPINRDNLRNPDGQRTTEARRTVDGQRNPVGSPNTISTRNPDGTWDRDRLSNESQSMIPTSRLSQIQKASKVMGTPVKNLQDEKLGKVENILVDMSSGRILAVILSSGGFLGMGDELSAVPPTALRFTPDRDSLQLDASKEMLSSAPHFKSNQWPDFNQPGYAGGVYHAYKVEPYFTADATTGLDNTRQNVRDRDDRTVGTREPDNTARNARDRDDRALTPLDQGNSRADVETTAQIRKEITAGKNMSVNAKNVKIMTNQGRVTLRGPVNTAEEKRMIGDIANRVARSENVDNQLEVKLTTNNGN